MNEAGTEKMHARIARVNATLRERLARPRSSAARYTGTDSVTPS